MVLELIVVSTVNRRIKQKGSWTIKRLMLSEVFLNHGQKYIIKNAFICSIYNNRSLIPFLCSQKLTFKIENLTLRCVLNDYGLDYKTLLQNC